MRDGENGHAQADDRATDTSNEPVDSNTENAEASEHDDSNNEEYDDINDIPLGLGLAVGFGCAAAHTSENRQCGNIKSDSQPH